LLFPFAHTHSRLVAGTLALCFLFLSAPSVAQKSLQRVDDETRVREITWNFRSTQTFDTERLQNQIATKAPGTFYRLKRWFDWVPRVDPGTFPFDPVTLQKDVVRLRQFYRQNGFLKPSVDYPASQFNAEANTIDIRFLINEGPPLIVTATQFRSDDGRTATALFSGDVQREWQSFRAATTFQTGERYTEFKRLRIEETTTTWLRDQGYAFAQVTSTPKVDTTANEATVSFIIDPGPQARFGDIQVEGTTSLEPKIVRRELPFREGDRFNASKVTQGQRELFGLNLFRVALADIPSQERDSTVTVRYRVREAKLRTLSGQLGYGGRPGVFGEGRWTHRNFYGAARNLSVGLIAESGWPVDDPLNLFGQGASVDPQRRFRLSTTLRQPYVFTTRLSGSFEPFFQERLSDKLVPAADRWLGLNERQFGFNTRLTYEILPFRTANLQYTFTRTRQFTAPEAGSDTQQLDVGASDLFDKSIISLNATFGDTDDFINPTQGFLVRPSAELGGALLGSDVEFAKLGLEVTGYQPLDDQVELAARFFAGRIWPLGDSRDALTLPSNLDDLEAPAQDAALASNFTFQNRFSDFLFYAGGSSDVRGWPADLAGGKVVRFSSVTGGYVYEAIGARTKVGANLELRLPFPGLGESFRTAVFLDAARVGAGALNLTPPPGATDVVQIPESVNPNEPVIATETEQLLAGTGAGMRYRTPAGFIRLDIAYKLTPDRLDLRNPQTVGDRAEITDTERENGTQEMELPPFGAEKRFLRRFRLHFGIGRTF
jgi:outer membrane protein insertion porin family